MCKKWKICILIAVLLCALLPCALGDSTSMLWTEVPSSHTVTITCSENGGVWIDGVRYTGTVQVAVPRLGSATFSADADDGCRVDAITVIPEAGATIGGNSVTLDGLYEDKHITVNFVRRDPYDPPAGERLYDGVLGTGGGQGQLDIVFDEDWLPRSYTLMPIRQGNTLMIEAVGAAGTAPEHRSLLLQASQIQRLIEQEKMPLLHFRNDALTVTVDLSEMTEGAMAWMLQQSSRLGLQALRTEEVPADETELAKVTLTRRDLYRTWIELRTVPHATEKDAWQVQVFLRAEDTEVDVTAFVTTLRADFPAPTLEPEVEAARLLDGTLYWLPAEQEPDHCEYYLVAYDTDAEAAEVSWQRYRPMKPERLLVQEALPGEDGLYRPAPECGTEP